MIYLYLIVCNLFFVEIKICTTKKRERETLPRQQKLNHFQTAVTRRKIIVDKNMKKAL